MHRMVLVGVLLLAGCAGGGGGRTYGTGGGGDEGESSSSSGFVGDSTSRFVGGDTSTSSEGGGFSGGASTGGGTSASDPRGNGNCVAQPAECARLIECSAYMNEVYDNWQPIYDNDVTNFGAMGNCWCSAGYDYDICVADCPAHIADDRANLERNGHDIGPCQ